MSFDDVTQLVLRERQSRDRGRYDDMAACFADESVVRMSRPATGRPTGSWPGT